MIEIINREDLKSLLINTGQNTVGSNLTNFADKIEKIESIEDIAYLCDLFKLYIKHDNENKVPKFARLSEEIFEQKIWSGCSDVGTALAPVLRLKGIPTIYVQSAHLDWISDLKNNDENTSHVRGHIFLEIYLNGSWILLDPTNRYLYTDYDYKNPYLPQGYYAFSKSLNGHELGFNSLKNNNDLMKKFFLDNPMEEYVPQNCYEINLRDFCSNSKSNLKT